MNAGGGINSLRTRRIARHLRGLKSVLTDPEMAELGHLHKIDDAGN